ncbi:chemotaxis protein CheB [Segetibacter koreensis]|uniref:chemotaxis protein CheB n=1 Tax=Segetibacter koreensis TaxID=398037 RepID=UPI000382618E|nr:chemotaxis protein CheB [Segetibacter koreensis]
MAKKDIIVVGASAGGVNALRSFVKYLPVDFTGSVFVVLHIPPFSETRLALILTKSGPLQAVQPRDGEEIKPGIIYVAANDHHLLLENGKVVVKKGPKENRFRPSIDALFRSAAYVYGPRVVGIVLSGLLDDGTSGLWSIKRLGGTTIIQQPEDAEYPQMPKNVLEYVEVDYTVAAAERGRLLENLITEKAQKKIKLSSDEMKLLKMEVIIATNDNAFEMGIINMGELTPFTCPECHGCLVRLVDGSIIRFRCHTGHAFTASALLADVTESVEEMLWMGMCGMEEINMLLKNIEKHLKQLGYKEQAEIFAEKAEDASRRARIIHDSVFKQELYSEDIRYQEKAFKQANKKNKIKNK